MAGANQYCLACGKLFYSIRCTKIFCSSGCRGWRYEQEWRYIEEYAGSYDFPGKLTEVILE